MLISVKIDACRPYPGMLDRSKEVVVSLVHSSIAHTVDVSVKYLSSLVFSLLNA